MGATFRSHGHLLVSITVGERERGPLSRGGRPGRAVYGLQCCGVVGMAYDWLVFIVCVKYVVIWEFGNCNIREVEL